MISDLRTTRNLVDLVLYEKIHHRDDGSKETEGEDFILYRQKAL